MNEACGLYIAATVARTIRVKLPVSTKHEYPDRRADRTEQVGRSPAEPVGQGPEPWGQEHLACGVGSDGPSNDSAPLAAGAAMRTALSA